MNMAIDFMAAYSESIVELLPFQNVCACGSFVAGFISLVVAFYLMHKAHPPF